MVHSQWTDLDWKRVPANKIKHAHLLKPEASWQWTEWIPAATVACKLKLLSASSWNWSFSALSFVQMTTHISLPARLQVTLLKFYVLESWCQLHPFGNFWQQSSVKHWKRTIWMYFLTCAEVLQYGHTFNVVKLDHCCLKWFLAEDLFELSTNISWYVYCFKIFYHLLLISLSNTWHCKVCTPSFQWRK